MKFLTVTCLAVTALTLTDSSLFAQRGRRGGNEVAAAKNGWLFSLREGKQRAQQSGKPLMVVVRCAP